MPTTQATFLRRVSDAERYTRNTEISNSFNAEDIRNKQLATYHCQLYILAGRLRHKERR